MAEHAAPAGVACWCCGRDHYQEHEVVRLGGHPEVALCRVCTRFLDRRARQAAAGGVGRRWYDAGERVRDRVMSRGLGSGRELLTDQVYSCREMVAADPSPEDPAPLDSAPGESVSVALALVNTRRLRAGAEVEQLADPAAAERWLTGRDLLAPGVRLALTGADLVRVRALREAVRELLLARIEQRGADPDAVRRVNRTCAAVPLVAQLSWPEGGPPRAVVTATARAGLPCALASIAADAIELVSSDNRGRLLACGAPGCIRLLLADHPRRAWCSTACGDRVRARRYHQRHRAQAGPSRRAEA